MILIMIDQVLFSRDIFTVNKNSVWVSVGSFS